MRLINIVDDSLLPDVMNTGIIDDDVQKRMSAYVKAAEETGADAVLSLCSSLDPALIPPGKQLRFRSSRLMIR